VVEYSTEIVDRICERIADGESLRSICADDDMPSTTAVMKWLANDAAFVAQYARAREMQADVMFDEILDIADDGRNDWMERRDEEGGNLGWKENGEALNRSRIRIDARKWMAGKLRPKKYGDKLALEHDVTDKLADRLGRAEHRG
jgi:hypothetical protein